MSKNEISDEERDILISRGQIKDPHPNNEHKTDYGITRPQHHKTNHDNEHHNSIDEKLRVDQIDSQIGRVSGVSSISSTSSIGPVQSKTSPVDFADALDQWRTMSERYRNQRLAKDTSSLNTNFKEAYSHAKSDIEEFQDSYESDSVDIHKMQVEKAKKKQTDDRNVINNLVGLVENKKNKNVNKIPPPQNFKEKINNDIREKIITRLSTANLEIEPDMIDEYQDNKEEEHNLESLKVSDVMTKNVVSVIDSMTVEQLASIFNKKGITSVPVIDYRTKQPIGIITMSDIVEHVFSDGIVSSVPIEGNINYHQDSLLILEKPIREIMNYKPLLVNTDSTVQEVCQKMLNEDTHRALIIDNGKVKGIFTSFDAVKTLAKYGIKKV